MIHRGPDGGGEYLCFANGEAVDSRESSGDRCIQDATPHEPGRFAAIAVSPAQATVRATLADSRFKSRSLEDLASQYSAHVFLAMRRLAIIDLAGGWQPLYNEDRSLVLVANGEIYNYKQLRRQLESTSRHTFRTNSDCEVILHLYEDFGTECVDYLRGMFAFSLWDAKKKQLVLARDRMGEKPLYLRWTDDTIFFASEMKAIVGSGLVDFSLEPFNVHQYMHFGWVPEPETMVLGVRKLAPGHLLIVRTDPWEINDVTYWRFESAPPVEGNPAELLREEIETIISLQTHADVPVAVALSGGVDSSLIAALAARDKSHEIHAFTVGYSDRPPQDERAAARTLTAQLRIPFHEIELAPKEQVDFFPELNRHRDDPINDVAGHGYYALAQKAREMGFKVLLQGQGGDELFWGYQWVVRAVHQSMQKVVGRRVSAFEEFLANVPSGLSRPETVRFALFCAGVLSGWKRLGMRSGSPSNQLIFYDINDSYQIGERGSQKMYTKSFLKSLGQRSVADIFHQPLPWKHVDIMIMSLLCRTYLLQNGLAQSDRLSMANSVETRLPLVDFKLVELVVGIQKRQPAFEKPAKALLKEAVKDVLPADVFRRPKRGFNPPVKLWTDLIRATYGRDLVDGYLVQNEILDPKSAHLVGRPSSRFGMNDDLFGKLIRLEYWCRGMTMASIRHS